jgi:spore protease
MQITDLNKPCRLFYHIPQKIARGFNKKISHFCDFILCILYKREDFHMSIRTDMAAEAVGRVTNSQRLDGVTQKESYRQEGEVFVTETEILTDSAAKTVGKRVGRYVTVKSADGTFDRYSPHFIKRAHIIADEISRLCNGAEKVLVTGLGNPMITPDALGSVCADRIFATRHIKRFAHEIDSSEMTEVSAVQTGVMGQTGLEAAEQIKALCREISPDCVIAVDALACSELSNLGCTVQMTDTGISPGSGVENARQELSEATLGVPCIAVGIPTVTDLSTATEQIFGKASPPDTPPMMVTPRGIDLIVLNGGKYIALGINLALQKGLTAEDIISLTEK